MRDTTKWRRAITAVAVLALTATACGGDEPSAEPTADDAQVATGVGVTEEPCPDAVNEDNGCIYLGVITDLSGAFAAVSTPLTEGQQAFWQRVNEQGGIGGAYDVSLEGLIEDAAYDGGKHAAAYAKLEPEVAALAQTLGTSQTLGIREDMGADDVVGAVATWWSGWEFDPLVLQTGSNYCIDTMNGIDWAAEQGITASKVVHVFFPNDYGLDANAGLKIAAEAHGFDVTDVQQIPVGAGGDVTSAVTTIVGEKPEIVLLTVGPTETGQIIGGAAQNGYRGMFLGNHPTYNPALMDNEGLVEPLVGMYRTVGPHEPWGADTDAHRAMQEAFGEGHPDNDGWTFGWMISYPLKATLEAAFAAGDLTRAGIVAAAADVTVDYEGALPSKTYGGDADDTVQRVTTIGVPDPEADLGLSTLVAAYAGSTAAEHTFDKACFEG